MQLVILIDLKASHKNIPKFIELEGIIDAAFAVIILLIIRNN